MKILKESKTAAAKAAAVLHQGGVVICPTDTVYGFLALASNKKAIDAIFKIKHRPKSKPLSLFVVDFNIAKKLAIISPSQAKVLRTFWPGKVTAILQRKPGQKFYGVKKDTIGIRIPNHPFLKKLLKKIDGPLVQTSVNISDNLPLNIVTDIVKQFNKFDILLIDGGDIKNAKPSKVIDLSKNTLNIVRP